MRLKTVGFVATCLGLIVLLVLYRSDFVWLFVVWGALALLTATDLFQTKHSIRRNFPILGRFRYLFESIRPEINQYFIESNIDGMPFNRETRSLVYQRAKNERDTLPFGTRHNVYTAGFECIQHSLNPTEASAEAQRVVLGGPNCAQPYNSSIFVISAMSFGALSDRAIEALNLGARLGGFAHNSGEGGISQYHLKHEGDLIWQIGTGYFGCRDNEGKFCEHTFARMSRLAAVKAIELKLSQGAKPSLGGLLPGAKVTAEIAAARGVPIGVDVVSPSRHSAFSTLTELCLFVKRLRDLSEGKPIGIKLCVGSLVEFESLCEVMLQTGVVPDFITIDGSEGGTGAAPFEFSNHVGLPLFDALGQVNRLLQRFELRRSVKLVASGKIATGFDVIKAAALGADMCASARGMMLALGCIQALRCDSNFCPTGIATQDRSLIKGLVVDDKAARVARYHEKTIQSVAELLSSMGLHNISELTPQHVLRRDHDGVLKNIGDIYHATSKLQGTYRKEQHG